jgi:hypothetical protein
VYIAIENATMPPEQQGQQKLEEKVYPKSVAPTDDQAQLESIMLQNSQQGQAQQLEEALAMEQIAGSLQGSPSNGATCR